MPVSGEARTGYSGIAAPLHNLIAAQRDKHAGPGHSPLDAARTWKLCAPRLGARRTVKVAQGGKSKGFGGWLELPLTEHLPPYTAALYIYEHDMTRLLALDFDPHCAEARGAADGVAAARAETADAAALIAACGGQCFTDVNPVTGGRHLYLLWTRAFYFPEIRPIVEALKLRYLSFDPNPMLSRRGGMIVPPGAWVATNTFRRLTDDPMHVDWVLDHPNGPEVWDALMDALTPELEELEANTPPSTRPPEVEARPATWAASHGTDGTHWIARPGGRLPALSPAMERIARTGQYPRGIGPGRYVSDSDARQAVLAGAVSCGWQLADVSRHLAAGQWPGLLSFYARYRGDKTRNERLLADWRKAVHYLAERESRRDIHTRGRTHTGGATLVEGLQLTINNLGSSSDPHTALRETRRWNSAFQVGCRIRWAGPRAQTFRRVLAGMLKAAQLAQSMVIGFGVRELALLCGLDYSTVAKALKDLRNERDPFIVLVREHRHEHADVYQLVVPAAYAEAAAWRRWVPGRLGGIHPVFRELGGPAAFVYEVLTAAAVRSTDVHLLARISETAAKNALRRLAEEGLAERTPDGWVRGPADAVQVAERLGVYEQIDRIRKRYKQDREAWRRWLDIVEALRPERHDADDRSFPEEVIATLGPPAWLEEQPNGPPRSAGSRAAHAMRHG
ncbi:hypothetical protein ACIBH1_46785 [Nonomuraea sp. NPDC050663]|uniref:hypothetical protein n=1 Tax=Nonomuraea sp. NPDC050663 TaxID=3364370 RepID=UPI0037B09687